MDREYIPVVDLRAQHSLIKTELDSAIQRVMERADFILGEDVALFEEEFAGFCGTRHAAGVDSGTSALELGLRAFGIGPGDEVIVPAHTFIATAAAVTLAGACPVLVDVDLTTYNIDPTEIKRAITPRTRAIIPVHLYGLPAEMDSIMGIADRCGLKVIEDAAQATGALYKGRRVGSLGHAAAFSFYPTKNLGGCGDGGMLVTNDAEVAERVRIMRNTGRTGKYCHELLPCNHRLDTLQAAILRVKLRHLDAWNEARRKNAVLYGGLLGRSMVLAPSEPSDSSHVYHLYVVRTLQRDALQTWLRERGIDSAVHYPVPIHLQPFYTFLTGRFPVAERLCGEILSLPMYPEMTSDQVQRVAAEINGFVKRKRDAN